MKNIRKVGAIGFPVGIGGRFIYIGIHHPPIQPPGSATLYYVECLAGNIPAPFAFIVNKGSTIN